MAESQYPFQYTPANESSLRTSLTNNRLDKYEFRGGRDFSLSMGLYLWNARLAKSMQFPLHVLEVTLRNAIVEQMTINGASADWAFDLAYIAKLEGRAPGFRDALNKSKRRLFKEKMSAVEFRAKVLPFLGADLPNFGILTTDQVVASLPFDFWTKMLDAPHEREWQLTLKRIFPHVQATDSRRDIWVLARSINEFRNRVAHHRPIFHLADIGGFHDKIIRLIGLRCKDTQAWVRHHSTFDDTLLRTPGSEAGLPDETVGSVARPAILVDDPILPMSALVSLLTANKDHVAVCKFATVLTVVTPDDIVKWLSTWHVIGLADVGEQVQLAIPKMATNHRVDVIEPSRTVIEAGAKFFARNVPTRKKPTAMIVTTDGTLTGGIVGVVLKDDLRKLRPG